MASQRLQYCDCAASSVCLLCQKDVTIQYSSLCISTKDIAGVSCKDDSAMGARKQDKGEGRKSAIVYWRLVDTTSFVQLCVQKYVSQGVQQTKQLSESGSVTATGVQVAHGTENQIAHSRECSDGDGA